MNTPAKVRRHSRWRTAVRKTGNKLLRRYNLRLVSRSRFAGMANAGAALGALADFWSARAPAVSGWDCTGIAFSKDRPLQLDALLRSYLHHWRPAPRLEVIYRASNRAYESAYEDIKAAFAHAPIGWRRERDFATDVRELIAGAGTHGLFFLVDDIVFIRPVDQAALSPFPLERYIPSLRLAPHITYSHFADRPLASVDLGVAGEGGTLRTWRYGAGNGEWAFPVSLDGNVFLRDEMAAMAACIAFSSPNSLENALRRFLPALQFRDGLCFERARLINLPLNRVQREIISRAGNLHADLLLAHWQRGLRMDVEALYDVETDSVHADLPVRFVARAEPRQT